MQVPSRIYVSLSERAMRSRQVSVLPVFHRMFPFSEGRRGGIYVIVFSLRRSFLTFPNASNTNDILFSISWRYIHYWLWGRRSCTT
jgi:hypothetical protein